MNKKTIKILLFITLMFFVDVLSQTKPEFQIARLKYSGGGDWYNDRSAEINLLKFINQETTIKVNPEYVFVDISSDDVFNYPLLFITGHGNIVLSESEASRIRKYLNRGGFIYIDDEGLFNAKVVLNEYHGAYRNIYFDSPFGRHVIRTEQNNDLQPGQVIRLMIHPDHLHIFDSNTGERL